MNLVRSLSIGAVVGLALWPLIAIAGCCPNGLYELATPAPEVRLPADEAPHCFGGGEWWYYTGELRSADGRAFGVETVIFHVPRLPFLATVGDVWFAHYAVLDEASGNFTYEQTRALGTATGHSDGQADGNHAGQPNVGFELSTALIQMSGGDGEDHITAAMSDGDFGLDLAVTDLRGPILHGGTGYVPYGPRNRAFYYSRPRMAAAGTLTVAGQPQAVTGELWFDRQWGLALVQPNVRWDWFSLRLADGTEIMLFHFRDAQAPVFFGTWIPASGDPVTLSAGDFQITTAATWTSPATGVTYGTEWNVSVAPPDADVAPLDLVVAAVADNQEFDARASTFNIYWEGLCRITGTQAGQPVSGLAYVEQVADPPPASPP